MTLFDSNSRPPQRDESDTHLLMLRAALGAIPVFGPPAQFVLDHLVVPPLVRRQDEFLGELTARLADMERRWPGSVKDLPDNPAFVDALQFGLFAASRTSSTVKKEALRNAVINSSKSEGVPSLVIQQHFLIFVDRFTELHLLLLKLFSAPQKWRTESGGSLTPRSTDGFGLVSEALPAYASQRSLVEQDWRELQAAGLAAQNLDNGLEGDVTQVKRTTTFGDEFLAFVSEG